MTDIERWLPITGFEGIYEVSNQGRVRSVERVIKVFRGRGHHIRRVNERILRPSHGIEGRLRVTLHNDGIATHREVHDIVLEAFVGPRPPGARPRFANGHYNDCRAQNLSWSRGHTRKPTDVVAMPTVALDEAARS